MVRSMVIHQWIIYSKHKKKKKESQNPPIEWREFLEPLIRTIRELQKQLNIQEEDRNTKT